MLGAELWMSWDQCMFENIYLWQRLSPPPGSAKNNIHLSKSRNVCTHRTKISHIFIYSHTEFGGLDV